MLYDPKWDKTKADPRTIESLIAWLETKPRDEAYCFWSADRCLIAQFLKAHGFASPDEYNLLAHDARRVFGEGNNIVGGDETRESWTFGAALERARAALAEAAVT